MPVARSTSLRGLMRACVEIPGCLAWVLVHPLTAPVFHDGGGKHSVDPISSGQIATLPGLGSDTVTCALDSPWLSKFLALLAYQFQEVSFTQATMMLWSKELVAVIGIGVKDQTVAEARAIADEAARTLKRIHDLEAVRQELSAHKHLNLDNRESLLIVRDDGQIQLGTETGWDALYRHLRQRPSKKNPLTRLPAAMVEALPHSGKSVLGKLAITTYTLPGDYETLLPLRVVFLEAVENIPALSFEARVASLTPSQRATYNLVLGGFRNKEVAAELGVSYHTATHHVAAVLHAMQCQDRLQLMAMAAQESGKVLTVPSVLAVAPMPDLPRPTPKVAGNTRKILAKK